MKTPDTIYLQTCGDCCGQDCENCDFDTLDEVTWYKDKINDNDAVYFSEENVKQIMQQVVKDANSLIGCARRSAVFTDKIDASKYIPHIINLLKGETK